MLRTPMAQVLGRPAEAILAGVQGATAVLRASGPRRAVLAIGCDGDPRFVELAITPLAAGLDGPPAQLLTLHDVTEDRRANERLRLARTVFDTASEGIVVTLPDEDETIIDVNDAFCRLTGRSREDTVGENISRFQSDRHPPSSTRPYSKGSSPQGSGRVKSGKRGSMAPCSRHGCLSRWPRTTRSM